MRKELSKEELIEACLEESGLGSSTSPFIERYDGVDIRAIAGRKVRQWYLRLLDEGDETIVPSEEVSLQTELYFGGGRHAVLTPPEGLRKARRVKLDCWEIPAEVIYGCSIVEIGVIGGNAYACGSTRSPRAYACGGKIYAMPVPEGAYPRVESLCGSYDYGEDKYVIDERALGMLPDILNQSKL